MTREQADRVREFVREKGLGTAAEEIVEEGGPGTAVDVTLEIEQGGRISITHLEGMTRRVGKDGPTLKSTERLSDIDELIQRVKAFAGK